jgi:hypothetical protein
VRSSTGREGVVRSTGGQDGVRRIGAGGDDVDRSTADRDHVRRSTTDEDLVGRSEAGRGGINGAGWSGDGIMRTGARRGSGCLLLGLVTLFSQFLITYLTI